MTVRESIRRATYRQAAPVRAQAAIGQAQAARATRAAEAARATIELARTRNAAAHASIDAAASAARSRIQQLVTGTVR
jgi:hypothetical protein